MYKAVGISGCEPPQPPQFGGKINIAQDLNRVRNLAAATPATNFADQ
jgi:hypothetical protein